MREELQCWKEHLSQWNGRVLVTEKPSVVIETNTSKKGWGATSQGVRTGRPWSRSESNMHINCLEALAAFLAIKCFARDRRSVTILLRMDDMSAVTYVNKLGGTISQNLTAITKTLWLWCLQRYISHSQTPTGSTEHDRRRGIVRDVGQNRLETEPRGVQADKQTVGSTNS